MKKTAKKPVKKASTTKPANPKVQKAATRIVPKVVVEKPTNYLDISPRNKRRTRVDDKPDAAPIDDAPPPPIKTQAPLPARRTKKPPKPVVEPPADEDDEKPRRRTNLPDIPVSARRTRRDPVASQSKEEHGIDSARFVRMINRANSVVGVIPNYVPERMTEGYRFIEGEPTIPTRTGPENVVPGMKRIRPRDYAHPEGLFDAITLWRDAMLDDLDTMPDEKLAGRAYEGIIRRLTSILDEPQTFGHIYGAKPTGALAKALGYNA